MAVRGVGEAEQAAAANRAMHAAVERREKLVVERLERNTEASAGHVRCGRDWRRGRACLLCYRGGGGRRGRTRRR
jgi:hypothetical protein